MLIYLIDGPPMNLKDGKAIRILVSYYYYQKTDFDQLLEDWPVKLEIFADSGAYSAMTQGTYIDIDDYAEWLKKWQHHFNAYSNLDVIMDAENTLKNQHYLEQEHGLNPLPVFHVNEDFDYLQQYLEHYDYIALGIAGMKTRHRAVMAWLTKCFKMRGDHRYHGFALTKWETMKTFPWYSVDSSSWGSGFRYGNVRIFDFYAGHFLNLQLGNVYKWKRYAKLIHNLGFDWRDFAYRERCTRQKLCQISAKSYMLAEEWLNTRIHLVDIGANLNDIRLVISDDNS